jgi:Glycosyl transferase family 2
MKIPSPTICLVWTITAIVLFVIVIGCISNSLRWSVLNNIQEDQETKRKRLLTNQQLVGTKGLGEYNNSYKIIFGGCVRDSAPYIASSIETIYRCIDLLPLTDYKIVIYHNDSEDNTYEILKSFASKDPQKFILMNEKNIQDEYPLRTQRIAYARNQVLKHVEKSGFDYFFNMDMDDKFPHKIVQNIAGIIDYLSVPWTDTWDCLSFNRVYYYDWWAFRSKTHPENCWSGKIHGTNLNELTLYYYAEFQGWKITQDLYSVISAFNGFAIYRISKIQNCYYYHLDENKEIDCEHVAFHKQMTQKHNAKHFISMMEIGI